MGSVPGLCGIRQVTSDQAAHAESKQLYCHTFTSCWRSGGSPSLEPSSDDLTSDELGLVSDPEDTALAEFADIQGDL